MDEFWFISIIGMLLTIVAGTVLFFIRRFFTHKPKPELHLSGKASKYQSSENSFSVTLSCSVHNTGASAILNDIIIAGLPYNSQEKSMQDHIEAKKYIRKCVGDLQPDMLLKNDSEPHFDAEIIFVSDTLDSITVELIYDKNKSIKKIYPLVSSN